MNRRALRKRAADCKSVKTGSIPVPASKAFNDLENTQAPRVSPRVSGSCSVLVPFIAVSPALAALAFLGEPISQNALLKAVNKIGEAGRPHGFRTTFRTWVQDTLDGSHDLAAEAALGHVIGNKVRRAYARSDYLDQRAALMQPWADYVTGELAQVVQLRPSAG